MKTNIWMSAAFAVAGAVMGLCLLAPAQAAGTNAWTAAPVVEAEDVGAERPSPEKPTVIGEGPGTSVPPTQQGRSALPAEFDPAKNPRVFEISKELRCMVCANESIAESNADLAVDLRREVVRQVNLGKTNDEIIHFMVERYGDFVLYKPPFKAKTYLLWLGPILFLLLALWVVTTVVRSRKDETQMSPAIEEALALLRDDKKEVAQ